MDVSHAILFLENADFVRITGLYFPAKFELYIMFLHQIRSGIFHQRNAKAFLPGVLQ